VEAEGWHECCTLNFLFTIDFHMMCAVLVTGGPCIYVCVRARACVHTYVRMCMYVCKWGGCQSDPCTVTISWSFVHPRSSNPPTVLCLQRSTVSCSAESRHNRLVPENVCTNDEIVNQPGPHERKGYARPFLFHGSTSYIWGYLLSPIWKGIPLSDSVLLIVLSLVLLGAYRASKAQRSF
jgi:hypothetical protein